MTGADFQSKLDGIVSDLQTKGKGQTVTIMFRNEDNDVQTYTLSSDARGDVSVPQLAAIQSFIDNLKPLADDYETERVPVQAALEAFKTASAPHQALADAASLARKNYNDAVLADPTFQAAKTALETARADADYISAVAAYGSNNVSENYGNLSDAKGKYVV